MNEQTRRELLTVAEVALTLGQSAVTIRRKIAAGDLPAIKLGDGPPAPVRVHGRRARRLDPPPPGAAARCLRSGRGSELRCNAARRTGGTRMTSLPASPPPRTGRRKATYRSPAKARRAARLLTGGTLESFTGCKFWIYQCPGCGCWHITREEQRA